MANARKGGAIIVFDYEGNPIKRYNLTNAWPKSLEIGSLKAGDTNVLTEKLTIVYPGPTEAKLSVIRDIGVTRLSLGLEHFDDQVLELNGRAHRSAEIARAYACPRGLGFPV